MLKDVTISWKAALMHAGIRDVEEYSAAEVSWEEDSKDG